MGCEDGEKRSQPRAVDTELSAGVGLDVGGCVGQGPCVDKLPWTCGMRRDLDVIGHCGNVAAAIPGRLVGGWDSESDISHSRDSEADTGGACL